MEELEFENFEDFEKKLKALNKNRGLRIELDFSVSKGGYYRCEISVMDWEYRGFYDRDGDRNYDKNAFANYSENTTDSITLGGYTEINKLLKDVYKEVLYIINTFDRIKEREKLFNRRIKLEL